MTKQILLTLALAGACSIAAEAETINVQFGCSAGTACAGQTPGASSTQFTGAAATGNAGDYWNMVVGDSSLGVTTNIVGARNLYNTGGLGGGVVARLEWNSASHVVVTGTNGTTGTYANLFNTYIKDLGTVTSYIRILDLTPSKYYFLYMINQAGKLTGNQVTYTTNGTVQAQTTATTVASTTSLVQGTNYQQYTVQADGSGELLININGGSNAVVNGFQLTDTPEPGTIGMALGGIAMVGIGRLRRKRQS